MTNDWSAHAIISPLTTRTLSLFLSFSALPLSADSLAVPAPNPVLIRLSKQGFTAGVMGTSNKPAANPNVLITDETEAISARFEERFSVL